MKTNIKKTIGISLTLLLMGGSVAAGGQKPYHRHQNQQTRIKQGIRAGEITKGEAIKLKKEQARIHATRRHAAANGRINGRERQHLQRMRNRASRHIYFAKHNPRKARLRDVYITCHAPSRSCAPLHKKDRFYFGGHIGQPGWGFGWSTRGGS